MEGMARGGVLGCLKHMPGHGRATVDSHKEMPVVHASARLAGALDDFGVPVVATGARPPALAAKPHSVKMDRVRSAATLPGACFLIS